LQGPEGRCVLNTLETLLSFTGEDCPFSIFFRQHFSCASFAGKEMCNAKQVSTGLPRCEWKKSACRPHPMALEFDMLQSLGVDHPDLLRRTKEAQEVCFAASSDLQQCARLCAPSLELAASEASLSAFGMVALIVIVFLHHVLG
jgi:hypothetical protein